jgi:glutamate/tyrosine decarboxylase-like PLP-dependent enzyme
LDHDYGVLARAHRHALDFIAGLDDRSVAATVTGDALRSCLDRPLLAVGVPAETVIDDLVADTEGGHLGSASGRFFGWVIGGALPSALAADWLAATWDNNAGAAACAPASCIVEEVAGAWLKDVLDLPRDASFALTTGCQIAHVTCLAAARNAVLGDTGWDVETAGLIGAPPIHVLANDQRHGSIERALRILGLGANCVEPLATTLDGRLPTETLRAALEGVKGQPTIVVLDGGDLNVGGFDDYRALIPMAKAAGAWVHVDGAFGLWARASREHRHLADGMDLADSWATDGHKWLNTPYDSGVAIVRDVIAHRASMALATSYIAQDSGIRDPLDWTPEWSRRARGLAVYAALRELGRDGLADLIDRCCVHAKAIASGIGALPGAELLAMPTLNQGLVRFPDPGGSDEAAHAVRTDAVIQAINDTGECLFSGATWRGKRAMRISVVNWRTDARDVERTIAAVAGVLERMA